MYFPLIFHAAVALSVCLSVILFVCLDLYVILTACLPISLFLCLCLAVPMSYCIRVSLLFCVAAVRSHVQPVWLFHCLSVSVSFFFVSLSLSLALPRSLSLSVCLTVPLGVFVSECPCLAVPLCRTRGVVSLHLCLSRLLLFLYRFAFLPL